MMHFGLVSAAALSIAAFETAFPSASVAATAAVPTPVPVKKPDFSSMKFMLGTWTCHLPGRGGRDRPDKSTTTIALNGQCMVSQDVAPPYDKYRTTSIKTTTYLGYDSGAKKWVNLRVDDGGAYLWVLSSGWNGNTLTFDSKGPNGTVTLATTKLSDTKTTTAVSIIYPKGKVQKARTPARSSELSQVRFLNWRSG